MIELTVAPHSLPSPKVVPATYPQELTGTSFSEALTRACVQLVNLGGNPKSVEISTQELAEWKDAGVADSHIIAEWERFGLGAQDFLDWNGLTYTGTSKAKYRATGALVTGIMSLGYTHLDFDAANRADRRNNPRARGQWRPTSTKELVDTLEFFRVLREITEKVGVLDPSEIYLWADWDRTAALAYSLIGITPHKANEVFANGTIEEFNETIPYATAYYQVLDAHPSAVTQAIAS